MDEQTQMQRIQAMQWLDSIYKLLMQGSQVEEKIASLLFIAYDDLKHYWLNIPIPSTSERVEDPIDEIELFLNNCADLD